MGRRSYEVMLRHGARTYPGLHSYVFSRTLRAKDYPEVTILADDGIATVAALRLDTGKDIWLTGGGELFRSLLEADLVDTVELGICPILLGQGIPLLPAGARAVRLALTELRGAAGALLAGGFDAGAFGGSLAAIAKA